MRRLSATMLGSLSGTQMVISCLGSWLILDERVSGLYQWTGLAVVIASLLWYVQQQGQRTPLAAADLERVLVQPCVGKEFGEDAENKYISVGADEKDDAVTSSVKG